jgi:hypothetical protein
MWNAYLLREALSQASASRLVRYWPLPQSDSPCLSMFPRIW